MQLRTLLIGLCALICGISAACGAYLLRGNSITVKEELVTVVVAAKNIPRGKTISPDDLETRQWPKHLQPADGFVERALVCERTVSIPLLKGELLLESKLAAKGSGRGMAALIPAGMRAYSIQSPNVSTGVSGFILPGNHVDVLLTLNEVTTNDTGGGATLTLLQHVEVLAVDQLIDAPHENRIDLRELRSVTLLVNPDDAAKLTLGQSRGSLQLTLRSPHDDQRQDVSLATINELMGRRAPPPVAEPEPAPTPLPVLTAPTLHIRTLRGVQSGAIVIPVMPTPAPLPTRAPIEERHLTTVPNSSVGLTP